MKKMVAIALIVATILSVFASCGSTPPANPTPAPTVAATPAPATPIVKRPDLLDHKGYKFGLQPPEWVMMDTIELEAMDKYKDFYVFKFESDRSQNLQGAQIWVDNFTAGAEIARIVKTRVQAKFAGAAAGDAQALGTYFEQVVKSLSDATFSGFKKTTDYWVQMRYYKPDGSVLQDAFTYLVLFTIPRKTLDELVQKALSDAGQTVTPRTPEENTARQRVTAAFEGGM